jgi:hypothetical protein
MVQMTRISKVFARADVQRVTERPNGISLFGWTTQFHDLSYYSVAGTKKGPCATTIKRP